MPRERPDSSWTLLLAPGERARGLLPVLEALLASAPVKGREPRLLALNDLADLLTCDAAGGRLLLDADRIPAEDMGLLRRFLEGQHSWQVHAFGQQAQDPVARSLLARPGCGWAPWPLDLEQLGALLEQPLGVAPHSATGALDPEPAEVSEREPAELEDDLSLIESILADGGQASLGAQGADDELAPLTDLVPPALREGQELTKAEYAAFLEPEEPVPASPGPEDSSGSAPPSWFKDQVADLTDRVQRVNLSLAALREDDPQRADQALGSLQELDADLLGLTQFARTLGYLAAPPGPGQQVLRLDTLLEELLGSFAAQPADHPRYLFRSQEELELRSDKVLLLQTFDAVLAVATACAAPEDEVRVAVHSDARRASVEVTFPAGPLAELPSERIFEPYALRTLLPQIGPNALAAAARILRGQGGELFFGASRKPSLRSFVAHLPLPH